MEPEEAGAVSTSLARTSPVWRTSFVDWRRCRVPGVYQRLLQTDQSNVKLLHDQHCKRKHKDKTTGLIWKHNVQPNQTVAYIGCANENYTAALLR